jgi:glutamyl-tRNA synthetase
LLYFVLFQNLSLIFATKKSMSDNIRVRFAPSPTGPLHMGGVRTALFNYLFARKHGGTFILRIEDTDKTRYVDGAEQYISEALQWCGLTIDEGVGKKGKYAPYRQSERMDIYKQYAQQLIDEEKAYYAFDTAAELDTIRKQFESEKKTFAYDTHTRMQLRNSLSLSKEETQALIARETPYVVRFKIPENREVIMQDLIRGEVKVHAATLDDKVLFKSDGLPTYHLANVTDDHLMKISHVIRGEEWLPSLPLHVLLYEALGWQDSMPEFAHLPLILKPSGKGKLSKRDGDKGGFPVFPLTWERSEDETAIGYRESGYFPEAFINMLAFLGWNPGTEQEIFSMDELIKAFSLDQVGKAGARFDPEKAAWFNHQYMQKKTSKELYKAFNSYLQENMMEVEKDTVLHIIDLVKERANFVRDIWEQSKFFFIAPKTYDEKVVRKVWKEDTPELLKKAMNVLKNSDPFTPDQLKEKLTKLIEKENVGFGKVMMPLRLCMVGSSSGPDLFEIISLLGKEESVARIEKSLNILNKTS